MATDFELAHQTPMFNNYGSSASGFYARYGNCRLQTTQHHYGSGSRSRYCSPIRQSIGGHAERKPGRPCLVNRAGEDANSSGSNSSSSGDETEVTSPIRQKKKVVFADDRGLSLTQVRMMVELPHSKPFSFNLPCKVDNNAAATLGAKRVNGNSYHGTSLSRSNYDKKSNDDRYDDSGTINWTFTFHQPASNYLHFRRKLDEDNVSLENIIIKENTVHQKQAVGTIKVRNLCYEKSVFVRTTTDNWITYEDVACSFVDNSRHAYNHNNNNTASCSSVVVIYDTFSFTFPLSPAHKSLEFCICFRTVGGEFWDNNEGKNYKLVRNDVQQQKCRPTSAARTTSSGNSSSLRNGIKSRSWPEF